MTKIDNHPIVTPTERLMGMQTRPNLTFIFQCEKKDQDIIRLLEKSQKGTELTLDLPIAIVGIGYGTNDVLEFILPNRRKVRTVFINATFGPVYSVQAEKLRANVRLA